MAADPAAPTPDLERPMTLELSARRAGLLTAGLALAAALGWVAAKAALHSGFLVIAICLLPLVPALVLRPRVAAIGAIALLPFQISVVGDAAGGLQASVSDVLLFAAAGGLLVAVSQDAELRHRLGVLRPLRPLFGLYVAATIVVSAPHPDLTTVVNVVQRIEIVLVPLVIGALLVDAVVARVALTLFVVAACVLAAAWLLPHSSTDSVLGVQKNPAGQFVVDAVILLIAAMRGRPWRWGLVAVLLVAVYATQSRGSLIGLLAALLVLTAVRVRDPLQFTLRILAAGAAIALVYVSQPDDVQQRIQGTTTEVQYSDRTRRTYADDAVELIRANPWIGVGIGNYRTGEVSDLTYTTDPHNVALLETAEGGVPLIAAFVVLQVGTVVLLVRRRRHTWAVVAVALQTSVLVHSLFDVYWVRGTPVLAWLVVGMAMAAAAAPESRRDTADAAGPAVPAVPATVP
ncbi:O-antigen ligase family protein [Jatrophihabitans sp. YIM 134969]